MDVCFDQVTKMFGAVIGLNNLTCRITPGITGLFGSNGAGKSTLLKLASGQLRPTLGNVQIGDRTAWSPAAREHFGFSPDVDSFYEDMTARQFVRTMALWHGYPRAEALERAEQALERVGMAPRGQRKLGACSRGMRQRIRLAQAIVHSPPVLLLDEPMTGIDPAGRRELSDLFASLASEGRTLLLSSHILGEVERQADRILMLARGRLIAAGTIPEIRDLLDAQPLTIAARIEPLRPAAARLISAPAVLGIEVVGEQLHIRTAQAPEVFALVAELAAAEFTVHSFEALDAGAEAVFHYLDRRAP